MDREGNAVIVATQAVIVALLDELHKGGALKVHPSVVTGAAAEIAKEQSNPGADIDHVLVSKILSGINAAWHRHDDRRQG